MRMFDHPQPLGVYLGWAFLAVGLVIAVRMARDILRGEGTGTVVVSAMASVLFSGLGLVSAWTLR